MAKAVSEEEGQAVVDLLDAIQKALEIADSIPRPKVGILLDHARALCAEELQDRRR